MNSGHTRIRRVAADLGLARAGGPRQTGHTYRPAAGPLVTEDTAALTFLSQILTGEETWSVGEVRRLLELRERGVAGPAGRTAPRAG